MGQTPLVKIAWRVKLADVMELSPEEGTLCRIPLLEIKNEKAKEVIRKRIENGMIVTNTIMHHLDVELMSRHNAELLGLECLPSLNGCMVPNGRGSGTAVAEATCANYENFGEPQTHRTDMRQNSDRHLRLALILVA
jgi:hypothetical protein